LTFTAQFSDPNTTDTHTATVNWGDGTSSLVAVTELAGTGSTGGSHAYAAAGTYTVTITVTDNSGASATVTLPVSVRPVAIGFGCCGPNALLIGGTTGNDTIRIVPQGNAGDVKILLNGRDFGTYAGSSFSEVAVFGQ